jgi:ABC-type phosphate transport system substrate-binding protein
MNEDSRQSRRKLRCLSGVLAAAVALLTAACSSSSPGGSAGAPAAASGSARPSPSPGGSSTAVRPISQRKQLAYSECMRSHGVPGVPTSFPSLVPGKPPSKGDFKPAQAGGPAPGSPQWEAAQQACRSLMPAPVEVPG